MRSGYDLSSVYKTQAEYSACPCLSPHQCRHRAPGHHQPGPDQPVQLPAAGDKTQSSTQEAGLGAAEVSPSELVDVPGQAD